MKQQLQVSMFQIPEPVRVSLVKLSAQSVINGKKQSINTLILRALDHYLSLPRKEQPEPQLRSALRNFTVRMTAETKQKLALTAAEWQVELGIPVSMNAVLNTAIQLYLKSEP
jgi:predicted HicB family RNase H-like nuclease